MSSVGKVGWKQLAIFGSVFLVVVGVPFVLVGFYATDHPFDWELASIFGTAVGTTLLALATGPLAGALLHRTHRPRQRIAELASARDTANNRREQGARR